MTLTSLNSLLDRNKKWASRIKKENPDFFSSLSEQQNPELLWIGCSDSRVPANKILDLPPGQIFVHRNIANLVIPDDTNCLSVIQYAVEVLKIKHIIICGHYGCGGVGAALDNQELGLIDHWLYHIREVIKSNSPELEKLSVNQKHDRLCELNVIQQVRNVCRTDFVQHAWSQEQDLLVHGWIYKLENGRLKELIGDINSNKKMEEKLR